MMNRIRHAVLLMLTMLVALLTSQSSAEARLLRNPAISDSQVAFAYAGDLWIVDRDGGDARRLTTFVGTEVEPHFSPDGRWVAFSASYDGNRDVYIVSVDGGEPKRLTWHPGGDFVTGWSNDGADVMFTSGRANAPRPNPQLWKISTEGGMPTRLPIPRAVDASYSPDGKRLAYEMVATWDGEWRNYRGGQAQPIRLLDLKSLDVEKIPGPESNNLNPVWIGDDVFFLSDRDWAMNVWQFNTRTKKLTQRTHFKEFDCKRLEGGGGKLVFENGGYLYTMEAASGSETKLSIELRGDFPWARPHWESVSDQISYASISPTGKRAVLAARGEIFSVPSDKGDIRNLSNNSGAADRAPTWSPDGSTIAWFSDESGEYQLVLTDQTGGERRTIELPDATFFYTPRWSPDSKKLAYADADRNLWILDIKEGSPRKVDDEGFAHPQRVIYPEWSSDSNWLAYARRLPSQYSAIFVYSLDSNETTQLTDGMSDAHSPAWDKGGKHLYFLSSTNYGRSVGWLDMSSIDATPDSAIYVAVLSADDPSPLAPESDEEEVESDDDADDEGDDKKGDKKEDKNEEDEAPALKLDFDGLATRFVALNVPPRPYSGLIAGEGGLYYLENVPNEPRNTLHHYSIEKRESKLLTAGVSSFDLSADGKKLLYTQGGGQIFITDAGDEIAPGKGKLNLSAMRMKVDPAAEWRQIFNEAWRYQRDFFYVDNVHGLDLDWAKESYGDWLKHVRHRDDLNYVLDILGGETAVGHSFNGGGDTPDVESVPVGLLGADYEIDNGRLRVRKIYNGENWNPNLQAPLSGAGIDAHVGDYLLAVNGVELKAGMNLYSLFDRTAGLQTRLTLNSKPTMKEAREITVVPVRNDGQLRTYDWVEGNRRRVDEMTDGQVAYVWLPDTGGGGFNNFNRYFFAQQHKKAAIIDERYNSGGFIADYIVDLLDRDLMGYFNNPIGDRQPFTAPNAAIWGPKVMLINEMSGSGGDMLPYMFRKRQIGPLIGTKTWGGLVGIWDVPGLIDGGFITAPRGGFYDTDGNWSVENEGVAPDIEVEMDPKLVAKGLDPQLEKAIAVALEKMKSEALELLPQPADPVRSRRPE
jgi:tricorn protease